MTNIQRYKLDTAFTVLSTFDVTAGADDFMEVSLWHNEEGFDARVGSNGEQNFHLTWQQFKALKKLIKELRLEAWLDG